MLPPIFSADLTARSILAVYAETAFDRLARTQHCGPGIVPGRRRGLYRPGRAAHHGRAHSSVDGTTIVRVRGVQERAARAGDWSAGPDSADPADRGVAVHGASLVSRAWIARRAISGGRFDRRDPQDPGGNGGGAQTSPGGGSGF